MLQGERHAALELAAASKAEVAQLQEAQRRLQWQSQLLEKMSEVSPLAAAAATAGTHPAYMILFSLAAVRCASSGACQRCCLVYRTVAVKVWVRWCALLL